MAVINWFFGKIVRESNYIQGGKLTEEEVIKAIQRAHDSKMHELIYRKIDQITYGKLNPFKLTINDFKCYNHDQTNAWKYFNKWLIKAKEYHQLKQYI